MALRNLKDLISRARTGLGTLPNKGGGGRKVGGGFMPQPRLRPMPMPINRPPQMIQPMPINRPMPMPISGRPPILNKGPGSGPMPIQGGRPPAPILGGNDFLPNPGFGVAPVGTPQPNFDLEALRGIPNQTNFPMPGGQMLPMLPNENQIPFTPPGMEGIQEAINQQLPFGNLGSGLPGGQQPIPMMPNETSVPFNPNRPGIDPRQMPISIGRNDEGRPPAPILGGNDFLPNPGDLTSIGQPLPNDLVDISNISVGVEDPNISVGSGFFDNRPVPQPILGGMQPLRNEIGPISGNDEINPNISVGSGFFDDSIIPSMGNENPVPFDPSNMRQGNANSQLGPLGNIPVDLSNIVGGPATPNPKDLIPSMGGGRLPAPILGGSDFLPKPGFIGRPGQQPISIGGPGGGITSIGQPLDGNTPGLPRLPGGQRPSPPLNDFGFGPGIRPSEIITPDGQFIGSGGITPPDSGDIQYRGGSKDFDFTGGFGNDPDRFKRFEPINDGSKYGGTPDDPYGLLGGMQKDTFGGRSMEFRDTDMNGVDDRDQPDFGGPSQEYLDREAKMRDLLNPGQTIGNDGPGSMGRPVAPILGGSDFLPEPPSGLTAAPAVTAAPVIEPAPVTPPQSTTVAGNNPSVTGGMPAPGVTNPAVTPPATPPATPPVVPQPGGTTPPAATSPATTPAATTPAATTATDPVASQNPFVSNLVRNETGMDAITKQLLFGLDGQGGFIPGAMQASENTFFNADGTPRVVEENVAGMTQDQKYAQELARQSVGMQDPYLQQAQDAYGAGIDVLGQGLASAQQRGEQALGATAAGVAEEQALRDQGLASTLKGLGQGSRLATDATSGLAGQLGDVEGIQRRATQQFQEQAGGAGADATGATDRFGNRLGESEQMLRGTTGGYNQSMTDQFYNPYEDAVVDQVSKDLFKQYDKGDIAARASDIARGGESAYGSRARLGAGERAEAMGRGLAEAIGGIRSRGFQQAQQAGLGEFARQKQAERTAASGLSGLAGQRLGAQQQLGGTLRGISGDQLSAQQNLASGLGALAGQRYQAGTNLGSTLAGYGSQAGSALGGAGQAALGSAGQLAGAYGTMGGLEGQIGQQAQQAMFGLGSNMQGLGAQAQGATQQDIAQMYGLGQGQQQLNQQRLDAMRRNALTAQQAPLAQYQSLMPFMQMVPQGQFQTQTTFAPRPSALQAGLGVGLSSLGAMGQFMNQGKT